MKEPTIDPEQLAALLDGRLDERARAELLARLASSEADLEIYAEAAAIARELEPARVFPAPPLPVPRRWRLPGFALAAALALVATLPWVTRWRPGAGGTEDPAARYVDALATPRAGLPPGWEGAPWTSTRGAGDPLTAESRAVRLGARFTDLRLAALARDSAATDAAAADVGALLAGVSGGGAAAGAFEEVRRRSGGAPAGLDSLLTRAWPGLAQLAGAAPTAAGAWLETARVAAARRDARFFQGAAARGALDRAAALPNVRPEAGAAAARARAALPADGAPDWDALGGALAALLGALGS